MDSCILFLSCLNTRKQRNDYELRVLNRLGLSVFMSRGAGLVLAFDCSLLLICVCRNLWRILRNWTGNLIALDHATTIHKQTAISILLFTLIHVNAHYTNFFLVETRLNLMEAWKVHYNTWAGITGHSMLIIMFFMYSTANAKVRKEKYELFWYTHHLFVVFYLMLFFHSFGCFVKSADTLECKGYNTHYFALFGFVWYLLERIVREYRSSKETRVIRVLRHAGNVLEIQFQKKMSYKTGQYIYLNFPMVSYWQWHPFTLTSIPSEDLKSIHMSVNGDWTEQVSRVLCSSTEFKIKVDGPFGAPAQDYEMYSTIVLAATGIGVTPSASILKSINHNRPKALKKLYFIWIVRSATHVSWFHELLEKLEDSFPQSFLEIKLFLTEKMDAKQVQDLHAEEQGERQKDSQTNLYSKSNYGRPKWSAIFDEIANTANGKVGVFFCGPKKLSKELKIQCMTKSNDRVDFDWRPEHF